MKPHHHIWLLISLLTAACGSKDGISYEEFQELMGNVAEGWTSQNTDLALSSFHKDVIYMEPPDIQYYRGHRQLRPYFDALNANHKMEFHHLMFDQVNQIGAGEYTFGYGSDTADTGVIIVKIENEKIVFWREYQRKGPASFKDFIGITGKDWEWTIENYP